MEPDFFGERDIPEIEDTIPEIKDITKQQHEGEEEYDPTKYPLSEISEIKIPSPKITEMTKKKKKEKETETKYKYEIKDNTLTKLQFPNEYLEKKFKIIDINETFLHRVAITQFFRHILYNYPQITSFEELKNKIKDQSSDKKEILEFLKIMFNKKSIESNQIISFAKIKATLFIQFYLNKIEDDIIKYYEHSTFKGEFFKIMKRINEIYSSDNLKKEDKDILSNLLKYLEYGDGTGLLGGLRIFDDEIDENIIKTLDMNFKKQFYKFHETNTETALNVFIFNVFKLIILEYYTKYKSSDFINTFKFSLKLILTKYRRSEKILEYSYGDYIDSINSLLEHEKNEFDITFFLGNEQNRKLITFRGFIFGFIHFIIKSKIGKIQINEKSNEFIRTMFLLGLNWFSLSNISIMGNKILNRFGINQFISDFMIDNSFSNEFLMNFNDIITSIKNYIKIQDNNIITKRALPLAFNLKIEEFFVHRVNRKISFKENEKILFVVNNTFDHFNIKELYENSAINNPRFPFIFPIIIRNPNNQNQQNENNLFFSLKYENLNLSTFNKNELVDIFQNLYNNKTKRTRNQWIEILKKFGYEINNYNFVGVAKMYRSIYWNNDLMCYDWIGPMDITDNWDFVIKDSVLKTRYQQFIKPNSENEIKNKSKFIEMSKLLYNDIFDNGNNIKLDLLEGSLKNVKFCFYEVEFFNEINYYYPNLYIKPKEQKIEPQLQQQQSIKIDETKKIQQSFDINEAKFQFILYYVKSINKLK